MQTYYTVKTKKDNLHNECFCDTSNVGFWSDCSPVLGSSLVEVPWHPYKHIYGPSGICTTSCVINQNYNSSLPFGVLWSDHHGDKQYNDLVQIKTNTQYFL